MRARAARGEDNDNSWEAYKREQEVEEEDED